MSVPSIHMPVPEGRGSPEVESRGQARAKNTLRLDPPARLKNAASALPETLAISTKQMSVELLRSRDALAAIEVEWQALADSAAEPNPFYEPWMVLPALERLEERPEFAIVWAPHPSGRKGERLMCGFFPLCEKPLPVGSAHLQSPVWTLWKNPYTYLSAPLVRKQLAREALGAFFEWMESSGRAQRTVLRFEDIPGDGVLRQALVDELRAHDWHISFTDAYTRAFFRPAETSALFFDRAMTSKRRKEHRRLLSKLGEQGPVQFQELGPDDDFRPWAAEFAAIEAKGWKGREEVAVASHRHLDYFEDICRHAYLRGRLMMLALKVGGRTVAMKMNLLSGDGGFAFKITYDEDYAKFSPGVLLEVENVERLHARADVRWMDSCAAPNRFMINHLWPERREMQTFYLAAPHPLPSLALSLMPLARFCRDRLRALKQPKPVAPSAEEAR